MKIPRVSKLNQPNQRVFIHSQVSFYYQSDILTFITFDSITFSPSIHFPSQNSILPPTLGGNKESRFAVMQFCWQIEYNFRKKLSRHSNVWKLFLRFGIFASFLLSPQFFFLVWSIKRLVDYEPFINGRKEKAPKQIDETELSYQNSLIDFIISNLIFLIYVGPSTAGWWWFYS